MGKRDYVIFYKLKSWGEHHPRHGPVNVLSFRFGTPDGTNAGFSIELIPAIGDAKEIAKSVRKRLMSKYKKRIAGPNYKAMMEEIHQTITECPGGFLIREDLGV